MDGLRHLKEFNGSFHSSRNLKFSIRVFVFVVPGFLFKKIQSTLKVDGKSFHGYLYNCMLWYVI